MSRDPRTAKVTAKVFLEGLMLICINKAKHCELGFIPCGLHTPVITIYEKHSDMADAPGVEQEPIPVDRDIYFKVINPIFKGVKLRGRGGETKYSYVPDFEGSKLHKGEVIVDTKSLIARVGLTAGELYSNKLSDYKYDLMSWVKDNEEGTKLAEYGKVIKELCLNVICKDMVNSGIDIIDNATGQSLRCLPKRDDVYYEVHIDSTCESYGAPPYPTDFRLYYKTGVVKVKDGKKFDFRYTVEPPSPEVCQGGHLSKKSTLGMSLKHVS